MAHSHSHIPKGELSEETLARQRKALRIMMVILIPIGVWTLVGLIVMWPGNVEEHIQQEASAYTVDGVTIEDGRIVGVAEVDCSGVEGGGSGNREAPCADLTVEVTSGPETGEQVQLQLTAAHYQSGAEVDQKVRIFRIPVEGGPASYQFSDFSRSIPLIIYGLAFMVAVVAVARLRGFISMIGLGFAGFIMVKFMFPALISGANPILVGLIGSSAIMFVVLYAAHGFSTRTTTALVGTLFGLGLSALLGWVATSWGHLTGVSGEDDFVLLASAPDMQLTSVVICGMILAGLGALNDVTITQASAVWELAETDPEGGNIFRRAMRIGRDHIASSVYTLVFATAGASLSVLLLISIYNRPLLQVIESEEFAVEILRTLVGSIGLVLAIPLTTAIGAAVVGASKKSESLKPIVTSGNDKLVDLD